MNNTLKYTSLSRNSLHLLVTFSFLFIAALLLIPSVYVKAIVMILLGVLIFICERAMKLLIPASPGLIFWFGNFVSYIIGGIGSIWIFNVWGESDIRFYEHALFYLDLGFSFYIMGMLCAYTLNKPEKEDGFFISGIELNPISICIFSIIIILPVITMTVLKESSFASAYYNLVIGPLMSIEKLPAILLGIYIFQYKPKWWIIMLFIIGIFAISFEGISIGYGRQKIPVAVVTLAVVYISMHGFYKKRMSSVGKLLLFSVPLILMILFAINSIYRTNINIDRLSSMEERGITLLDSSREFIYSGSAMIDTAFPLFDRLVEKESIELLNMAESGSIEKAGWTYEDVKQVLLSWVPKILYPEKGVGYGRDIMEYYGLCAPWNNIPVTVLADTVRRSGIVGIIIIYFMIGVLSTTIALKIKGRWGAFGTVLAYYFALLHLDLNNGDSLSVITLYSYRFISGGMIIYAILRITRILKVGIFSMKPRPVY